MSDQFEWHIADEENDDRLMNRPKSGWDPKLPIHPAWLLVGIVIAGIFVFRQIIKQNNESAAALVTGVQELLDIEHDAYIAGDGPLYLSAFTADNSWKIAQLLPYNQDKARAGLHVTHAEQFNNSIRADVAWEAEGASWQNVAFFRQQNAQVYHVPPPADFWGLPQEVVFNWGTLSLHEADWAWQREMGNFIYEVVNDVCGDGCQQSRLPFQVTIRNDYKETSTPGDIYIPSPYLMALTESGEPAPAFWDLLREKVTAHLTPATIRFGVPPAIRLSQIDYQAAADEFMRLHPDITIELVTLTANPPAPEELVDLDGAALQLTQGLITNGLVYDLTDFALEDADLRSSDFYEQIWLASFWRERMWQIPHMAEMQLLFYDRMAYHTSGHAEPTLRWTWEEMTQDMTAVLATEPSEQMVWGYMDVSRDTLFSYAYNWKNDCTEAATVRCQRRLDDASVTAALAWYQQMVSSEQMPDVTGIAPDEAQQFSMVSQSLRRHSLIWVEDPMQYEHHLLLNAIGVLPFPGSDRFDGITPLRIHGNIITQHSQRPLAVWEWIKFLSYQPPVPRIRLIPARPSVASSTAYWGILPLPLGNAMRTAFPFARPILIEEQPYFPTEQLTAVLNGENPADAAREWPQLNWFTLDD